ncbi:MAG: MaoC family dehydratase [Candidatus Hodarchaeales archaeon]|jgi:3-hydroxybutyryl-CoA dehydratase
MKIAKYSELKIGQKASLVRTISEEDIQQFAEISGDHNPIHLDEDYARTTIFEGRIAHGILTAAFISTVIANQLPGSIYLRQTMNFKKPVRIGDTITVKVEVTAKNDEKQRIKLATRVFNQKEQLVLDGEAETLILKE